MTLSQLVNTVVYYLYEKKYAVWFIIVAAIAVLYMAIKGTI